MSKTSTAKSNGTSRVRFVMMEAEIADGSALAQFTQAIQNALRAPAPVAIKRISSTPSLSEQTKIEETEAEDVQETELDETEISNADASTPKVRTARKAAPKPSVVEIDLTSAPPLSSLADPKSNHKRYLAIAAWLHDHRNIVAVSADHIYTCYRHLGWPTNILDFAQPLRDLKFKQYFTTPERGKYAINQLGLAKAAELID